MNKLQELADTSVEHPSFDAPPALVIRERAERRKRVQRRRVGLLTVTAIIVVICVGIAVLAIGNGGRGPRVQATSRPTSTAAPAPVVKAGPVDSFGETTKSCDAAGVSQGIPIGGKGQEGLCVGVGADGKFIVSRDELIRGSATAGPCPATDASGAGEQVGMGSDNTTVFGARCGAAKVVAQTSTDKTYTAETFELPAFPGVPLYAIHVPANTLVREVVPLDRAGKKVPDPRQVNGRTHIPVAKAGPASACENLQGGQSANAASKQSVPLHVGGANYCFVAYGTALHPKFDLFVDGVAQQGGGGDGNANDACYPASDIGSFSFGGGSTSAGKDFNYVLLPAGSTGATIRLANGSREHLPAFTAGAGSPWSFLIIPGPQDWRALKPTGAPRARTTTTSTTIPAGCRTVPSVAGQPSYAAAAAIMSSAGFVPSETASFSDTVPAGTVIGPGQQLIRQLVGSTVTIQVSKGKTTVPIPDVVGQPVETAITYLGTLSLKTNVHNRQPGKPVIAQDPKPGSTPVAPGTVVQLYQ